MKIEKPKGLVDGAVLSAPPDYFCVHVLHDVMNLSFRDVPSAPLPQRRIRS